MAYFTRQIIFILYSLYLSLPGNALANETSKIPLPALSGSFEVGTVTIEMTDASTIDPFTQASRTILVQAFYPAINASDYPLEPYMGPATAAFYENYFHIPNGSLSTLQTNSHTGAPISNVSEPGVIIFSSGLGASRRVYTALVEDLASHGFIVISIDHPFEADIVEFSDGSVILSVLPETPTDADIAQFTDIRMKDTLFTLNALRTIVYSTLGVERETPLGGIGIFGHSFGGAIAANVMLVKKCVVAGINMDGMLRGPVVDAGLDRPFLLIGTGAHYRSVYETWQAFWDNQCGWKEELHLAGAEHQVFSDLAVIAELLGLRDSPLGEVLQELVGTIDGIRANKVLRAYITAFFEFGLRGEQVALLDGPDPEYKEMEFVV